MSSLRGLVGECRDELVNGVAWVVLYKGGRSWQAEAFYPVSGDYEDGFVFDSEDYDRMKEIAAIDHKAICINGDYVGGFADFTLDELEKKILWFYESRLHQLSGDFIGGLVVPLEDIKGTVDELLAGAVERSSVGHNVDTTKQCAEIERA